MVRDVYGSISEYAGKIAEIELISGETPKIICKSGSRCYMTVTGAAFDDLEMEDVLDITGHDPEEMPLASALMRQDRYRAIILATPPYMGICLESHHEIPAVLDDMAQIVGPKIEIVPPEEKSIAKALSRAASFMIENGCLVSAGRTLYEAFTCMQLAEKSAEIVLKAQVLGGAKPIPLRHVRRMRKNYLDKYSKEETAFRVREESDERDIPISRTYSDNSDGSVDRNKEPSGNSGEALLRQKLVELGLRLTDEGLVSGTWGNISARLDDETMICTPSGIDYARLKPDDMVKVSIKDLKVIGTGTPTSERSMHAGIYREYPEAGAIIHTHSMNCSVFAASEMPLQVEDMGKIARVGEIINVTKYALAGTRRIMHNAVKSMKIAPGAILSHHGMICFGESLDDAFDNAEAIEGAAADYIDKHWE